MTTTSQPLVSVVTPVYNGAKYLAQCIESVLSQSYDNWEYIIVDNCSSDETGAIAQHYAERDARIRVRRNDKVLPIMPNWNHAMRQVSPVSKYCKVVHADDWLFPECLDRMVEVAESRPSVSLVGSYRLKGRTVECDGLPYPSPPFFHSIVSGREVCRATLRGELYVFGSPSSTMIRSDSVRARAPFYDEHYLHADKEACFELLRNADFGFVHQVLTYSRVHDESQTAKVAGRYGTLMAENLAMLLEHGPFYFEPDEYQALLKRRLRHYYRFLIKSLFARRKKEFWRYHMEQLKRMGYPPSALKLVDASLSGMANLLGMGKAQRAYQKLGARHRSR